MDLYQLIYSLINQIPHGSISTPKTIAMALGDARAARTVGRVIHHPLTPKTVPCHRVVHSDGSIGKYCEGIEKKMKLLKREGITIHGNKIDDFNQLIFTDFTTSFPLEACRKQQLLLKDQLVLRDDFADMKTIGGVDVAYRDRMAHGAYVGMNYHTKQIVETNTVSIPTTFPYIPTYLSFRELPVVALLLQGRRPSLLMVDGNGILHPYNMGLASHIGLALNIPTVGVAKNLLCGKKPSSLNQNEPIPLYDKQKKIGFAVKPRNNTNPIYVSPGHRVSFETALKLVDHFSQFRVPEPIRQAHLLAAQSRGK
jgi:deoxyribonuclease V